MWENLECLGIHRHLVWMKCEAWRGAGGEMGWTWRLPEGVGPVVGALMCIAAGRLESHLLVNGKSLEKNSMT